MEAMRMTTRRKTKVSGVPVEMLDRNVFRVGVGSHAKTVDLESDGMRGWCDCEDFKYRVQSLRTRGFRDAACKHIQADKIGAGQIFLKALANQAGVSQTGRGEP